MRHIYDGEGRDHKQDPGITSIQKKISDSLMVKVRDESLQETPDNAEFNCDHNEVYKQRITTNVLAQIHDEQNDPLVSLRKAVRWTNVERLTGGKFVHQ